MAPLLRFETVERGFARNVVERHSPQAGFDSDRLVESGAVHSASGPVLLERRDNTGVPSDAPVSGMLSVTESTKALVGITVFLGVVVLAVAGLRLRKFLRRRSKNSTPPYLRTLSLCDSPMPVKIVSEKRNPMYTQTLLDFGYDGLQPPSKAWAPNPKPVLVYSDSEDQSVGWRPQVDSWSEDTKEGLTPDVIPRPFPPPALPKPAMVRPLRFSRLAAAFARSPKPSVLSFEVDAAPPYTSAVPTPRSSSPGPGANPKVSEQSGGDALVKPTPPPKRKHRKTPPPICVGTSNSKVSHVPAPAIDPAHVPDITVTEAPQTVAVPDILAKGNALKSPSRLDSAKPEATSELHIPKTPARRSRKSLFSLKHLSSKASSTESDTETENRLGGTGKKLPRLVVVVSAFAPNLQDELPIRVGEVLRMTREFHDGWCSVERLGNEDEHGVVPRFCVVDRPSIIPNGAQARCSAIQAPLTFTGSSTPDQSMQRTS